MLTAGTSLETTHLAFRVLLGNLHGPRAGPGAAVQDSAWSGNRWEDEPVVEHHVEDPVHILEKIDFVLPGRANMISRGIRSMQSAAYIVDWAEIDAVLHGISLELPVAVHDEFPIGVVDRHGLGVAISSLAALFGRCLEHRASNTLRSWLRRVVPVVTLFAAWKVSSREEEVGREGGQREGWQYETSLKEEERLNC